MSQFIGIFRRIHLIDKDKLAVNIMTMLYLFLTLFASQLFFVTASVIPREVLEDREETKPCKENRTVLEPTNRNTPKTPGVHGDIPPEKAEPEVNNCRRVEMFVNFVELGLSDMIIAPPGFKAYQCKGKCSTTQQKKFLNRALLLDLMEKKKGIKTEGETCCVPTKLQPISMLAMDERGKVGLRMFEDLVVAECGCANKGSNSNDF